MKARYNYLLSGLCTSSCTLKNMTFLMLYLFPSSDEMAGGHTNTSSFQISVFILEYHMLTYVPAHL